MKIRAALHTFSVLLALLLAGCAARQHLPAAVEVEIPATTFSFDQGTYPTALGLFPEYRLAPGDVLDVLFQIRTWQKKEEFKLAVDHRIQVHFLNAKELDQNQMVMPDGTISMPYIGKVQVVGKTVEELTAMLREKYATILRDPEIYVTVPEFRSAIKEFKHDLHTAPRGLSRLVTIRPDGYVTFPLAGEMFVAGRTIPEVNKELDARYESLIPGLHVNLFLEKHSGAVVYVMGEVAKPGAYKVLRPITIAHAIALAQGHTVRADLERVVVFRRHEKRYVGRIMAVADALARGRDAEFLYLRPDDLVYVPPKGITALGDIMDDVMRVLMFRGWNIGIDGPLHENPLIRN